MAYLNSVTLMGRLTADPEVRQLASGEAVASFSLAVNYTKPDDKTRRGEFFDCSLWGGWATNLAKTAKRGALVVIEGRLAQDRWIDAKTNQARSKVKIVARRAFHVVAQYGDDREPGDDEELDAQAESQDGPASTPLRKPTAWG